MQETMYNIITITISFISVLISLVALYYSIRYSYNPKLRIEPLNNKDVEKIVRFYDSKSSAKSFLRRNILRRKYKYAYGVWKNKETFFSNFVLLWTRIINESKYSVNIYDIEYGIRQYYPFKGTEPLKSFEFKKIDIYFENSDESDKITINYDDFIDTPIILEPFSCVEKYLLLFMPTPRFSKLRKTEKIRVKFCTSSKAFVKNLKVYTGFRWYKNTKIRFDLRKY